MGVICGGDVKDIGDNSLSTDIFSKFALEEFPCKTLTDCLAKNRIAKILDEFSKFKSDHNSCKYETMCEYINGLNTLYTNHKLLNDYIHLVTNHQTNEDYESIHNFLISEMDYKCDVITCNNLIRNQRDRSNDNNIIIHKQLYDTSDPEEVHTQQICDKIHCYFLHTFDLGYRLTENERKTVISETKGTDSTDSEDELKTCIDNELRRRQEIYHCKQQRLSITNSCDNNRSQTNVSNRNNRWVLNKNEYTTRRVLNNLKEEIYSFGYRYRYGRYRQHDPWFIPQKYENLRSELLSNNINQLTIDQFNNWFNIASAHLESDYCKSMKSYIENTTISVHHLLSIIIYCGADELQRSLTQTYRKHKQNESDEHLRKRHSEYSHWGGLLLETVNQFGVEVKKGSFEKFYHGIDHEMTFKSTIAYFHGPLSTSSEYEVALIFANQKGNNGLIIELHNLDQSHVAYFDCVWCSEYAYESEKFFIGGDFGLIIRNIIAPIKAQNYEIYIECLNIIQQMMRGNSYKYTKGKPIPKHVKKCVTKLLQHELYHQSERKQIITEKNQKLPNKFRKYCNLPIYIEKSLHYYCLNVIEISIDWRTLHQENQNKEDKGYKFTRDIFVLNEFNRSFIDLNALCLLFPNMHKITVSNLRLNRSAMEAMICFCKQLQSYDEKNDQNENENDSKLNEIIVYRPIKDNGFEDSSEEIQQNNQQNKPAIDVAMKEYANKFIEYGWKLTKKARFELHITKLP